MKKWSSKIKKVVTIGLVTCMTAGVVVGCGSSDSGESAESTETITLKFSSSGSDTSTWQDGAEKFVELIEEYTDGRYTADIYASDQLSSGNQTNGIELVQNGSTDIHLCDSMVWASTCEMVSIATFPWLLEDYDAVDAAMEGEGGEILTEALNESGVVCLAIGESGYRQIVNNKTEITEPSDLEGLVIRVPGSQLHIDFFAELGADAISMSQSEVYTSLQTGAIDSCENSLDLLYSQSTLETVSYLTLWNYSYDPIFLCLSNDLWDSLSEADQEAFSKAAEEAMDYQIEVTREVVSGLVDTIKEEYPDVEIIEELTAEQMAAFKEETAPVYEAYKDTFGEEAFAAFGYTFE